MAKKVVELAKIILGGFTVSVDQNCKESAQFESIPVIITSNTDLCIVVDGNSTTFEHKEPFKERVFLFRLNVKLRDDLGKISKWEIRELLR